MAGKTKTEEGERLSLGDAARFHMDTAERPMDIAVLLLFAQAMPLSALSELITTRLLTHPRFRSTVVEPLGFGRPHWRRERPFALGAHLRAAECGAGLSAAELAQVLSARVSTPLGFSRSPWHFELFELADETSAVLVRVHHCIADGIALVRLFAELADAAPQSARPPGHAHAHAAHPRGVRAHAARVRGVAGGVGHVLGMRNDPASALRAAPSRARALAWSPPIPLERVATLARAHGHRVSDVLLCALSGAVARCLAEARQVVPDRVRALVPLPAGHGQEELGNHYASVFIEVPLREAEPVRRLAAIAAASRVTRERSEARLALGLTGLAGALVPPLMQVGLSWFSAKASFVLSNVPGPATPVRLLGRDVASIVAFAPLGGPMALGFTMFGYAGALRLGVTVDVSTGLNPEGLVRGFDDALRELGP